jgi:hypothetical protein
VCAESTDAFMAACSCSPLPLHHPTPSLLTPTPQTLTPPTKQQ